ncbi:hypothetical protein BDV26DRAFT_269804 [Aspergillus bertholletiae]|uniref:RBR-type E3 ubiquitin transferase n=1 Tax=Aspergillus bertholletiae TaxID=1226010 RepID=A0A5N7AZN5_9EURO|nr:hypothetical protein BDV26DRAFT_269804 [Aspergillus bertholletiae]
MEEGLHSAMTEQHDLLLVLDATASMTSFLNSLNTSLRQVVSMSVLTRCFSRIGLLAYRDYSAPTLLEWSGWYDASPDATGTQPDLLKIASALRTQGNYDTPEAAKTGLAKAYEVMRPDAKTVIIFYTDAPPHMAGNAKLMEVWGAEDNGAREREALSDPTSYSGFGPMFNDWVSACNLLREGEKKAQVFCLLQQNMSHSLVSYYNYLCIMTQGSCIVLHDSHPSTISKVTIAVLLTWMGIGGQTVENSDEQQRYPKLVSYPDLKSIDNIRSECDEEARLFFPTPGSSRYLGHLNTQDLSPSVMEKYIHKKGSPITDFAKSWVTDPSYQELAVKHLKHIIMEDVSVIALNAVFAILWRNICNDRTHPARSELLDAFSLHVSRICNKEDRARMTGWLDASYDFSDEVEELINSVPESDRFPCVCLDPTLTFRHPNPISSMSEEREMADITTFTRAELLEIGQSCHPDILRRLSRVLTQLSYIENSADMPEHIVSMTNKDVPRIPMALARAEYKRHFWKILLHVVVPGTRLSSRPAAILAAFALKLGITPLNAVAETEVLAMRDRWNNIEAPETWTASCLSVLIDADRKYQQRWALEQVMGDTGEGPTAVSKPRTLLNPSDRELFEKLIAYRFLELNLHRTITAQVGWKPKKTTFPIGPLVTCRICQYPRSVTIMGQDGQCGMCISAAPAAYGTTRDDTEQTPITWVECYTASCRAQYVVYRPDNLRLQPKCHYCRTGNAAKSRGEIQAAPHNAPFVECRRCLSRIIWPEPYRPAHFCEAAFVCPACTSGRQTIVEEETTVWELAQENTMSWLIKDSHQPDGHVFSNRSLYRTVSTIGPENFVSRITLFPVSNPRLTVQGKLIQNSESIVSKLQNSVSRYRSAKAACSLCFSNFPPTALSSACGRRGCQERICKSCLSHWYGLNIAGGIINTAALACPFCRRFPSAKTLAKNGMGIHAVKDLQAAIQNRGTWIYAWCRTCATAKPYLERICAQVTPAEATNWRCEGCSAPQNSRARPCPGCGVMTEKISGCGHIQCEVEDCHTHWCYFCGDKFDEAAIYSHMTKVHGTIYDLEDDLYYDDVYD